MYNKYIILVSLRVIFYEFKLYKFSETNYEFNIILNICILNIQFKFYVEYIFSII